MASTASIQFVFMIISSVCLDSSGIYPAFRQNKPESKLFCFSQTNIILIFKDTIIALQCRLSCFSSVLTHRTANIAETFLADPSYLYL
jgi:hypothetical protein